jgi:hypothetical protein
MSTACRNGDPSTSGIVSSKCEFFAVIANEQNLRLVVLGDVLTALKKCKELVTFEESLAWVISARNSQCRDTPNGTNRSV